jgi:arginase
MPTFDLALAFPQWQGSGRPVGLARGGVSAAAAAAKFAPRCDVPIGGAGEQRFGIRHFDAIRDQLLEAQAALRARAPRRVLTAGGDCSVDVATFYLAGLYPGLSVIWIDAHLDANTPSTSPSGNFHDMPVATIHGAAPPQFAPLLAHPVDPERFAYWGPRVWDPAELDFARARHRRILDGAPDLDGHVHVHFDLDVLDPSEFPHLAFAEEGGPGIARALEFVAAVAARADIVGLTVTEFAPADDAAAAAGQGLIERIFELAAG